MRSARRRWRPTSREAGVAVAAVRDAVERGDEAALRSLLHPYLHWTDRAGVTVRGRRNVLALLGGRGSLAPPSACELRDGQVYRWREAASP